MLRRTITAAYNVPVAGWRAGHLSSSLFLHPPLEA